jgi:hypothetical protein
MMGFISLDDEIPNWMEKQKMFQTTNRANKTIKTPVSNF